MSAALYYPIYLLIVTILTAIVCQLYSSSSFLRKEGRAYLFGAILLTLFMILFIGLRPIRGAYFVDMAGYASNYERLFGNRFVFDSSTNNIIFDNWFAFMASIGIPVEMIFVIFAAVYFGMIFVACQRLFPKDTLLALLVYLAAFSTFTYGTNGMKAGMAASTFLVAIAYRDKLWLSIPIALFTYGQHHSMVLVIAAYFLTLFLKNPKYFFVGWLLCFVLAALHVTYFQILFAGFTDEHGAEYLLSGRNSGFRIDFILYSAVPIWFGYKMIYKYKIKSEMYSFILNLYLCTNSLWLLCMYSNFTNRISYLSWFMYPFVLLYPFVKLRWSRAQPRYLRYVVYGHLGFTLFMTFVYYG